MRKIIRILLADDHKILREGIVNLLEKNIVVIAESNSGLDAVKLAKKTNPDVILMDLNLPEIDGIEATKRILKSFKGKIKKPKILILSMYNDELHIMESIRAGAMGYITKSCSKAELMKAVNSVIENELYIQRDTVNKFLDGIKSSEENERFLTAREIEIMKFVAQGFSNKEIGKIVYSAEKTVKNQLNSIFQKLHCVNRAEAVKETIRRNIISSDLP